MKPPKREDKLLYVFPGQFYVPDPDEPFTTKKREIKQTSSVKKNNHSNKP